MRDQEAGKVKKQKKTAVRTRAISDVPMIQRLINHFADKGEMLPRSLNAIYENIRDS